MTLTKSGKPRSDLFGVKCDFEDHEIQAIREERASGVLLNDIAKKYEISAGAVASICVGRTYKNAPGPISAPNSVGGYKRSVSDEQLAEIAARKEAGETISSMAKELGITRSYLSILLTGYNKAKKNES